MHSFHLSVGLLVAMLSFIAPRGGEGGSGGGGSLAPASIAPEGLLCEFRENPEGIASTKQRLSWRLRSTGAAERGVFMGAYQVVAAGSAEALKAGGPLVWDSGKVAREGEWTLMARVEYGAPLRSRERVWWKVRVWDQEGRDGGWSEPATFSIGLLGASEWKASWIGLDAEPVAPLTREVREELRRRPWIRLGGGPERKERVAFFRAEFDLPEGKIADAWIAGTVDMMGEVSINGKPVAAMARWELIRAIDVKSALVTGRNAIGIRVEQHDGLNPAVSGMIVVRMQDGTERRVLIDKSWKLATAKADGWDRAGFDDSKWSPVEEAGGQPWGGARNTEHFMPPTPMLRTTFTVPAGKVVRQATLYATALGAYEPRLNGKRVGARELAPGWTEYTKRVEHQTYDVTGMITPGANCVAAVLGDGWYASVLGYTAQRRYYGGPARFLGQLEVTYADGTTQVVATDPTWRASFGPYLYTDLLLGSAYDSRLEMPGWDTASFDAAAWKAVDVGVSQTLNRREADVTAKVAGAMKEGKVSLRVGPQELGDPAYGVVKTLRVEYTVGGKAGTVELKEGETLSLPRAGETGALVISKAVFGEPPAPAIQCVVEPQPGEPVRRFEELSTKVVTEPRPGRYIFDLGQNMVGWARLKVNGTAGQRLVVRHAEMLNPDGTMYTSNLRGATATDYYTLKGGPEILEPAFTFHGFQYVEITGLTTMPDTSTVTGIVIHNAMRPTGTFTSSNPLLNQLVHNIVWGQKGNYLEAPTDCPQRDERLGWTGDAQFFINTAAYTFDIASFMSRWLHTLNQDSQLADGTFSHVSPKVGNQGGSTAWGDAAIVCTYALYQAYADTRVISTNYDAMCRYMVWLDSKTTDGIAKVGGFGDWLNLGDPTSSDLIDTAYRAELCRLMSEMGGVIGRESDAVRFKFAHEDTVKAFRARFLAADGSLKDSGQTGYALAFTMGLIPDAMREKSAAHFAATIERKNGHLATGFIGTPRLLPALAAAGRDAEASKLLLNEGYPSWLYQVKLGATTMWERWDGWTPDRGFSDVGMNSFNHYAFGAVGDYLYRHVAGISALEPGYARILVAPTLTEGLEHAAARFESPVGAIVSMWRRTPEGVTYEITIPANTRAEIRLPLPSGVIPGKITEGGKPLSQVKGLSLDLHSADASVARLRGGSGTYVFTVPTR